MIFGRLIEGPAAVAAFVRELEEPQWEAASPVAGTVSEILAKIQKSDDRKLAVVELARRFDATKVEDFELFVTAEELKRATVEPSQLDAIRESIARVTRFHEAQLAAVTQGFRRRGDRYEWTVAPSESPAAAHADRIGFEGQRLAPVRSAGIYAPGGQAVYPSSVIMNSVPALVAGVTRVVLATPARPDGSIHPAVLVAARELGISKVLKAGGAYAIGAMALGLGSDFPPCDVLAGPGNIYVNEAKRQLWGRVGLDLYAGPSEVAVYADDSANPAFAAADLLTQVEHAIDNAAYLIVPSRAVLDAILVELELQLTGAPREATMRTALAQKGVASIIADEALAVSLIDAIAPEHLSLLGFDPHGMAGAVSNAGCILLGPYSAQSAGDYCSGPSHTLPTARAARFSSPVNVMTFMKFSSITYLEREDLMEMVPTIRAFGAMEGFPAHAQDASIRL